MGNGGYWVMVWDGWGAGLVMLNPRMLTDGVDWQGGPLGSTDYTNWKVIS